jgi:guanylate kinase
LNSRAKDNQDVIKNRMALARDEISHWPEYDYVLINNDLDKTENDLKTIIKAERLKLSQQPKIVDDVRNLNNEFENR